MIPQGGYIKLFRKIQDNPFWSNEPACRGRAIIDLILLASHNKHAFAIGGNHLELDRGELAVSVRFLARRWKWGIRKTLSFLGRLEHNKFLVKKRNGSGNGSPSIYHIDKYDLYQGEAMPESNGFGNADETVKKRLGNKTNKGKKGKKESIYLVLWEEYVLSFSSPEQNILQQTREAISGLRKTGKVSYSVLDKLAEKLSKYPINVVLRSCQIYLEKNCAAEGKGEKYLLGIVRGEFGRNGQVSQNANPESQPKTPGQLAIERALQQQEAEKWDDL
jgi:hypothetical protein